MNVRFGEYTLDWNSRQLFRNESPVHLPPKALELLKLLIDHRPRALSKAELHERLWPSTFVSDGTLTSLVAELRGTIGDRGRRARFLRTVHGFGYSFSGEITEFDAALPRYGPSCWLISEAGRTLLREGENILGRDRGLSAWFESVDVSRRHARILLTGGEAVLEDLQSRNGTFVGGERLSGPHKLIDGEQIGLGSVLVTFRAAAADASTESRVPDLKSAKARERRRGV